MSATELSTIQKVDATALASHKREKSLAEWNLFAKTGSRNPHAAVLHGDDRESIRYTDALIEHLASISITRIYLPQDASTTSVDSYLTEFSQRQDVDAIVLMTPLPKNAEPDRRYLNRKIPGPKDADGANLSLREENLTPIHRQPTPAAVVDILEAYRQQGLDFSDQEQCRIAIVGLGQVGGNFFEMVMNARYHDNPPDIIGLDIGFKPSKLADRNIIISATGVEGTIQGINPENLLLSISVGPNEFAKGIRGRIAHHTRSDVGILARERLGANIRRAAMRDRVFNGFAFLSPE